MAEIIVENPPRKDPDLPVAPQAVKAAPVEEKKAAPAKAKEDDPPMSTGSRPSFGQGRR